MVVWPIHAHEGSARRPRAFRRGAAARRATCRRATRGMPALLRHQRHTLRRCRQWLAHESAAAARPARRRRPQPRRSPAPVRAAAGSCGRADAGLARSRDALLGDAARARRRALHARRSAHRARAARAMGGRAARRRSRRGARPVHEDGDARIGPARGVRLHVGRRRLGAGYADAGRAGARASRQARRRAFSPRGRGSRPTPPRAACARSASSAAAPQASRCCWRCSGS